MRHLHRAMFSFGAVILLATVTQGGFRHDPPVPRLTIIGTLLAKSPAPGYACGIFFPHQLGLYRLESSYGGALVGTYLVVDHPSCFGDVFAGINIGDRVRVSVDVVKNYSTIYTHPGIRESPNSIAVFYVASSRLEVIYRGWLSNTPYQRLSN